jgi:hypothetical protein
MIERRPIQSAPSKNADVAMAAAVNGGGAEAEVTAASPLMDRLRALERLIIKARSEPTTAAACSNLLRQLGFAITAAAEFAACERDKSLDALQCDPDAARAQADDAEFLRNRLASQQPLLLARSQQVSEQEAVAAYVTKRDALRGERDTLERELTEVYSRAAAEIVALFQRVNQFKQRAHRELGFPPASVAPLPELAARPLLDKVQLFQLDGQTQLWPPPSTFAAEYVQTMTIPSVGAAWADPEVQERRRAEIAAEQEKMARHHSQMSKEQEALQNSQLRADWERRNNGRA